MRKFNLIYFPLIKLKMKEKKKEEQIQEIGEDQEKLHLLFHSIINSNHKFTIQKLRFLKLLFLIHSLFLINFLFLPIFYYFFTSTFILVLNIGIIFFFFIYENFLMRKYPEIYLKSYKIIEENKEIRYKVINLKNFQVILLMITILSIAILIISIIKLDILVLIMIIGLISLYYISSIT